MSEGAPTLKAEMAANQQVIDELNQRLRRKTQEVEIIQAIAGEINTTLDLDCVFELILDAMDNVFGFRHVLILLKEPDREVLRVAAGRGYEQAGEGALVPFGQGVIGVVAQRRKLMRMLGLGYRARYMRLTGTAHGAEINAVPLPGLPNVQSQVAIPLVVKDELVGVFAVESPEPSAFDALDEQLLTVVGSQMGAAIANARAFRVAEDLKEHLEERVLERTRDLAAERDRVSVARAEAERARLRADVARAEKATLAELARRANEETSLEAILAVVAEIMERRIGANSIALYVRDPGLGLVLRGVIFDGQISCVDNYPPVVREIPLVSTSGSLYHTFRKGRPLYVARLRLEWLERYPIDAAVAQTFGFKWYVQTPLFVQEEVVGIFAISGRDERRLRRAEVAFAEEVGTQVAGAVRAAELLRQTEAAHAAAEMARRAAVAAQEEADRARRQAEKLNEVAKALNASTDVAEVLALVMDHLNVEHDIDSSILVLVDEARQEVYADSFLTAQPFTQAQRDFVDTIRIPIGEEGGIVGRTFARQKPFLAETQGPHDLFRRPYPGSETDRAIIETLGFPWFLILPLVIQGRCVGMVLLTSYHRTRPPARIEVADIVRFAEQIAGAVHGADLLRRLKDERDRTERARAESDRILTRILPARVAEELKREGQVEPLFYDAVSVLFSDFVGFTVATQRLRPDQLVAELDGCFSQFDAVVERNGLEKLKTIGDAYMCAAGLPVIRPTHAIDACLTALEFRAFMAQMAEVKQALGREFWQIRIGIHSGPVTAGVIGTNKFAYDIWGDTVNTASRMESSCAPGEVNISRATYDLVHRFFECERRGFVAAKGKGELEMFFLRRIRPELSADTDGLLPNARFEQMRAGFEEWTEERRI